MGFVTELLISAALVVSGIFGFVGSYGLVKLKDTMQRLHAPTKATTLGVGGTLVASIFWFYAEFGYFSIHEFLITLFLFLTAPITAHFMAKAWLIRHLRPEDLPDTKNEFGWALYDDPPQSNPDR